MPLILFTENGNTMTCAKSEFMHKLEEMIPGEKRMSTQRCDVVIFDGLASIQMLGVQNTVEKATFKIWHKGSFPTFFRAVRTFQPAVASFSKYTLSLTSTPRIASKLKPVQGEVKDKAMSTMLKVMHSFLRTGSSF